MDLLFRGEVERGSRGAKSFGSVKSSSVMQLVSKDEVHHYMSTNYGVSFDASCRSIPLEQLKEACYGIEKVARDFKGSADGITLKAGTYKNASAKAGLKGSKLTIYLNKRIYKDKEEILDNGLTVTGNDRSAIISHEMGHILTYRMAGYQYRRYSSDVYQRARKNTKQTSSAISRYAVGKRSETIAEAFGDVSRNGNNAQQISKEIYNIVKGDWSNKR